LFRRRERIGSQVAFRRTVGIVIAASDENDARGLGRECQLSDFLAVVFHIVSNLYRPIIWPVCGPDVTRGVQIAHPRDHIGRLRGRERGGIGIVQHLRHRKFGASRHRRGHGREKNDATR
jgi:hypothetical protein